MSENTMHLLLEINRLKAEILVKDTEIESLKKEIALQKLSDISQEIEDRRAILAKACSPTIQGNTCG